MSHNHHPDEATLLSYAAGVLPESFDILLACHLRECEHCRAGVAEAEQLGGLLLEAIEPVTVHSWAGELGQLEAEPQLLCNPRPDLICVPSPELNDPTQRQQPLPAPLQQLLAQGDTDLPWRWLAPGIQQIRLATSDGGLRLLKIAPGISIPRHSHQGSELTLILQGTYRDEQGRFRAGDLSDAAPELEHQPITEEPGPCICLVATDAPLRYRSLIASLLQPLTGF